MTQHIRRGIQGHGQTASIPVGFDAPDQLAESQVGEQDMPVLVDRCMAEILTAAACVGQPHIDLPMQFHREFQRGTKRQHDVRVRQAGRCLRPQCEPMNASILIDVDVLRRDGVAR